MKAPGREWVSAIAHCGGHRAVEHSASVRPYRDDAEPANIWPTSPVSTISPAYITAARSQICPTRPRLCEMNSIDVLWAAPQLYQQFDDAGLDRHVERGGRFVQQQQAWLRQQRHRDHDPLQLSARELMRIGGHDAHRVGQIHLRKHGAALFSACRHDGRDG